MPMIFPFFRRLWAHSAKQAFKVVFALILAYMFFVFTHFALTTPLLYRKNTMEKAQRDMDGIFAEFDKSTKDAQPMEPLEHVPRCPGGRLVRVQHSSINGVPLEAFAMECRRPAKEILDYYFNYYAPRGWVDTTRESMKMRLNPNAYKDWNAMQDKAYVDKYQKTMANSLVMKGRKASIHITITKQGRPAKNLVSVRWFGASDMSSLIPRTFVGKDNGAEPAMVMEDPFQNGGEKRSTRFYRSRAEPRAYFNQLSEHFEKQGYEPMFTNVPQDSGEAIFSYFSHPKEGRFMLVITRDPSDPNFSAGLFLKM
jgi:hypothetical protein